MSQRRQKIYLWTALAVSLLKEYSSLRCDNASLSLCDYLSEARVKSVLARLGTLKSSHSCIREFQECLSAEEKLSRSIQMALYVARDLHCWNPLDSVVALHEVMNVCDLLRAEPSFAQNPSLCFTLAPLCDSLLERSLSESLEGSWLLPYLLAPLCSLYLQSSVLAEKILAYLNCFLEKQEYRDASFSLALKHLGILALFLALPTTERLPQSARGQTARVLVRFMYVHTCSFTNSALNLALWCLATNISELL